LRDVQFFTEGLDGFSLLIAADSFDFEFGWVSGGHNTISFLDKIVVTLLPKYKDYGMLKTKTVLKGEDL